MTKDLGTRTFEVGQNTELGRAGISIISRRFCGPPCGLGDVNVTVRTNQGNNGIDVTFYDMDVSVHPGNPGYDKIRRVLEKVA